MVGVENVVSGFKLKARVAGTPTRLAQEAREELKLSQSHQKA